MLYLDGIEVERDYKKALKWLTKAEEQYDSRAQALLGFMYEEGKGVPQDDKEAANWYQKAANTGFTDAQIRLAKIYEKWGEYEKAQEWYKKGRNTV